MVYNNSSSSANDWTLTTTWDTTTGYYQGASQCFPSFPNLTAGSIAIPASPTLEDVQRLEKKLDALIAVLGKKEAVEVLLRLQGEEVAR